MKSLLNSFRFAFNGVWLCIKNERNMRIHICIATYVLLFSLFYNLSKIEYAILILSIAIVFLCEMINTSIENVVDIKTKARHPLAAKAKDIAAGSVLVSAIFSPIIGFILFWDIETFCKIFDFFLTNPLLIIALSISLVFASIFIFFPHILFKYR